jgi:hypothetical protein
MSKSRPQYIIARNKITRLVDVIDLSTLKSVSSHPNHDEAEAAAAKLMRPITRSNGHGGGLRDPGGAA